VCEARYIFLKAATQTPCRCCGYCHSTRWLSGTAYLRKILITLIRS